MIEGTPGQPYGGTMSEFNTVEDNMRKRRKEATSLLRENQALCTITSFPRLVLASTRAAGVQRADHNLALDPQLSHCGPCICIMQHLIASNVRAAGRVPC